MKQPLLIFTTQMTAQPGGAFLVKPGKPIQWAKCSEAARHLGISPRTLRDWIDTGSVPEAMPDGEPVYRKRTPKLWEFNLPAIEILKAKWTLESVLR